MLQETTDGNTTTAILSFTNITVDDNREFSCIMLFQNPLRSSVNTIRVIVSPGKLYIFAFLLIMSNCCTVCEVYEFG